MIMEMHTRADTGPDPRTDAAHHDGFAVEVDGASRRVKERGRQLTTLLGDVTFSIAPGELVAIVGPSGAGKTTLLETMAGVAPATDGSVRFDGLDVHANLRTFRGVIGFVPQDDTIHADLPLQHTLHYAARLRLPSSTPAAETARAVVEAMATVGLAGQAGVRVGAFTTPGVQPNVASRLMPYPLH